MEALTTGPIHWFENWPTGDVPRSGAIVYTIWDREGRFIYVGISGRDKRGPRGRLSSHASGCRSGDQFCVYVCDRLVLPQLHNHLTDIADGTLTLDVATGDFIQANLGFRWVELPDGASALQLERRLQRGEHPCGRPLLNPLPVKAASKPSQPLLGSADKKPPRRSPPI